jgi:hypothetical protein
MFALAASPARHSFLSDHHIVEEYIACHEQVDWYVLLGQRVRSQDGLLAFDDGYMQVARVFKSLSKVPKVFTMISASPFLQCAFPIVKVYLSSCHSPVSICLRAMKLQVIRE